VFTGIIQAVGIVQSLEAGVLAIQSPTAFAPKGFDLGESISISGCCLTVVEAVGGDAWTLKFDLSPETVNRTSLGCLGRGSRVNLERAMVANGRFGGHVVQGHVDTTGSLASITEAENSWIYRFETSLEFDRYLIDKGSITIEGISLTVVEPSRGVFDTWIIPHTLQETNLGSKRPGDAVNLEFDVIAKYVEKLLASRAGFSS
jgi:riboflavin synthase